MIRRILLGYDGSAIADKAFAVALDFARHFDATLDVLAIARPPDIGDDVETEAIVENTGHEFRRQMKKLETVANEVGARVTFHLQTGHPAQHLLAFAENHAIDHIIVGHLGKSAIKRWLVGSVSRQVIDHAKCLVTVVR
ncbi:MAG: universal stress protein [Rhodanobacteraceae bacterium]|nr:universal stress protein [Pseudomonadota bacterium]